VCTRRPTHIWVAHGEKGLGFPPLLSPDTIMCGIPPFTPHPTGESGLIHLSPISPPRGMAERLSTGRKGKLSRSLLSPDDTRAGSLPRSPHLGA
jgi:hypothetical protein